MDFQNRYLTYEEYKELGGNLPQMPFNLLEYQAEKKIDMQTSNRFRNITNYPLELKMCINTLITELKKYNESGNKSSETVGSYAVTYDKPLTSEKKQALEEIIKEYLLTTKINGIFVLYCGVDENDN